MRKLAMLAGVLALIAWFAYWLRVYLSAPVPDYKMQRPGALLIGGTLPLIIVSALLIYWLASWYFNRP